jgi:hypothetical protein
MAKNLKPLEAPKVPAPIKPTADPFDSYEKAAKAVNQMMKPPVASSSKGKGKFVTRIRTPPRFPSPDLEHFKNYEQSGFDWAADRTYGEYEYLEKSLSDAFLVWTQICPNTLSCQNIIFHLAIRPIHNAHIY